MAINEFGQYKVFTGNLFKFIPAHSDATLATVNGVDIVMTTAVEF